MLQVCKIIYHARNFTATDMYRHENYLFCYNLHKYTCQLLVLLSCTFLNRLLICIIIFQNFTGVRSCYDEGKRVAETLMFDYHRQHGIGKIAPFLFRTHILFLFLLTLCRNLILYQRYELPEFSTLTDPA